MDESIKRRLDAIRDKIQEMQKNIKPIEEKEQKTYGIAKCEICKGVGFILTRDEENREYAKKCDCFNKKWSDEMFKKSEVGNNNFSFENFKREKEWQKYIYHKAKSYAENYKNRWFYINGQVGAGKTHICVAILRHIGESGGVTFKYISCNEELDRLKMEFFANNECYQSRMDSLKNIGILYIDDFFKRPPSEFDKDKIFELIKYRYTNNKPCIFSSEKSLKEIFELDKSMESRITEKANGYIINLAEDLQKNQRYP